MTEKTVKKTNAGYVLATENKRWVNGHLLKKGDAVDVSEIKKDELATLLRLGIYKEVKK